MERACSLEVMDVLDVTLARCSPTRKATPSQRRSLVLESSMKKADSTWAGMLETDDANDRFAFRTPPLRNVELTGPYMHAGAYATLEDAIRHHVRPAESLKEYGGSHLTVRIRTAS